MKQTTHNSELVNGKPSFLVSLPLSLIFLNQSIMKNLLKISSILENKKLYFSVTISPVENYFEATFYLREKTKTGKYKVKTEKYLNISGSHLIPEISNSSVKHLGYTRYFHLKEPGFYLNLYFND